MIRSGLLVLAAIAAATATADAATPVQRGGYLVNTIMTCQSCHTPIGPKGPMFDKAFSGGLTFDEKPFKVTAPNITPDPETGIGKWSDADIIKLMRTGIRPNGVMLAPVMPTGFYGIITDSDMKAIVAYLRTVKPIKNMVPAPDYKMAFEREVFPYAKSPMPAADFKDKVKRGLYLATIGHCMECHTPMVRGKQDFAHSMGKGGRDFPGPWGVSISRNITSDKAAGLGGWSDAQIKRAVTEGIDKDGKHLKPPMGYGAYAHMADADIGDLIAYLRTVPPLK